MQRYANHGGQSGVIAYEIEKGAITVAFIGGARYMYTIASAGAANIERMHELAKEGRGLATFISRNVHDRYARKLD